MSHYGYDASGTFDTERRGDQASCAAPECIDRSTEGKVPEGWGVWCPHGKNVVVADPDSVDMRYPDGIIADPWPCGRCTRQEFDEEINRMAEEAFEIFFE